MAEKAGHDVSTQLAVEDYIKQYLQDYRVDTRVIRAITEEADSGVLDDRNQTSAAGSDIVNEDPDAAVWSC